MPAQDTPPAPPDVEEVTLLSVYKQGGWMMHVLLVCSIGTIAVVVYCFLQISPKKMCPKGLNDSLVRQMQQRDITNAAKSGSIRKKHQSRSGQNHGCYNAQ